MKPAMYMTGLWYLVVTPILIAYAQSNGISESYRALALPSRAVAYVSSIQGKDLTVTVSFNYRRPKSPSDDKGRSRSAFTPSTILDDDFKLNANAVLKFELQNNWKMKLKNNIVIDFTAKLPSVFTGETEAPKLNFL